MSDTPSTTPLARMGVRKDSLDRLFPYLLLAITMAALVPVLEMGFFQPIEVGYESMSISIRDWGSFLDNWRGDPHGLLYYFVLRVPALFGHSKLAWRSTSIIPGMMGVYLLGLIAAKVCKSKAVALLAAAAYGFSATMRGIFIAVRTYPLGLFLVLAAFYCLVNFLAGNGRRARRLMWFGILTSLAVATEFYAILFFLACVGALALLGAARPLLRGRALEWTRRNWRVLITAFGLPVAVFACFYLSMRSLGDYSMTAIASLHLPNFCWSPGTSRMDFVLRNLRADMNYMLPIEMSSAGVALGILAVFAPLLLYRVLCRKQSDEAPVSSLPGLVLLLLLAELIVLSLLRLYPFGGEARHQSILFPFFTLTAFLLLDKVIGFVPASGLLSWLRAGILAVAGAGICLLYTSPSPRD